MLCRAAPGFCHGTEWEPLPGCEPREEASRPHTASIRTPDRNPASAGRRTSGPGKRLCSTYSSEHLQGTDAFSRLIHPPTRLTLPVTRFNAEPYTPQGRRIRSETVAGNRWSRENLFVANATQSGGSSRSPHSPADSFVSTPNPISASINDC